MLLALGDHLLAARELHWAVGQPLTPRCLAQREGVPVPTSRPRCPRAQRFPGGRGRTGAGRGQIEGGGLLAAGSWPAVEARGREVPAVSDLHINSGEAQHAHLANKFPCTEEGAKPAVRAHLLHPNPASHNPVGTYRLFPVAYLAFLEDTIGFVKRFMNGAMFHLASRDAPFLPHFEEFFRILILANFLVIALLTWYLF